VVLRLRWYGSRDDADLAEAVMVGEDDRLVEARGHRHRRLGLGGPNDGTKGVEGIRRG
jgi:hypothetical protein